MNRNETTNQLIVRMRPQVQTAGETRAVAVRRVLQAGQAAGLALTHWRRMSYDAEVVRLPSPVSLEKARELAARLRAQPGVEWVSVDQRRYPAAVPNDPEFTSTYTDPEIVSEYGAVSHLWYLRDVDYTSASATALSLGINWEPAWTRTMAFTLGGDYALPIAVADTGILPHSDIDPTRLLPGYDFIADEYVARDGGGRDADPTDPGDWVDPGEACPEEPSSWHGTFVSGVIGATANNGTGIAGVNPRAKILPLRVLGRCGGFDSDIIDAIRWAAGLTVTGVASNPNPVKVVNLSLGGEGACETAFQNAATELKAAGVAVVVAAGNERTNVANVSPASCNDVITVGANSRSGYLTSYSNYGANVALMAPGGGSTFQIVSTSNGSATAAGAEAIVHSSGTSFSTPMVSAAVSMIKAVSPAYDVAKIRLALEQSATPFPAKTDCDLRVCGAGVLNVDNALLLAQSRLLANASQLRFVKDGPTQTLTLTNHGTAPLTLGTLSVKEHTAAGVAASTDFTLTPAAQCAAPIAAGASCTLTVGFTPAAANVGGRYAWVEIPVQGSTAVARVAVYGINPGVVLSVEPTTTLNFDGVVGRASAAQMAVFTNISGQTLSFSDATIDSADFSFSGIRCDDVPVPSAKDCRLAPNARLEIDIVQTAQDVSDSLRGALTVQPAEGSPASVSFTGRAGRNTINGNGARGKGGCTVDASGGGDLGLILLAFATLVWRRRCAARG